MGYFCHDAPVDSARLVFLMKHLSLITFACGLVVKRGCYSPYWFGKRQSLHAWEQNQGKTERRYFDGARGAWVKPAEHCSKQPAGYGMVQTPIAVSALRVTRGRSPLMLAYGIGFNRHQTDPKRLFIFRHFTHRTSIGIAALAAIGMGPL